MRSEDGETWTSSLDGCATELWDLVEERTGSTSRWTVVADAGIGFLYVSPGHPGHYLAEGNGWEARAW